MPTPTASVARQFDDVFNRVASGFATASPGSIASGASGSVAITIPGVTFDGTWAEIAVFTNATNLNVAGVSFQATVTAANTVTFTITNSSGGAITPTASSRYSAVMGRLDPRFYS